MRDGLTALRMPMFPKMPMKPLRIFLPLLLLLSAVLLAAPGEWRGWRGEAQQGRSAGPVAPLHWSTAQNVSWTTPIPGRGHSSPIVTQDTVYLTTARLVKGDEHWRLISGIAQYLLMLLLVLWGARFIVQASAGTDEPPATRRRLWLLIGFGLILLLLAVLTPFGEELLDFDRAPERPWAAAALFGTLALAISGMAASRRSWAPLLAGLALEAFAGFLAVTLPDRGNAFATGLYHPGAAFLAGMILLPALAGGLLLANYWAARASAGRIAQWMMLIVALLAAAAVKLTIFLTRQQVVDAVSISRLHKVGLPWWAPLLLLVVLVVSWRQRGADKPRANLLTAILGSVFMLTLVAAIAEAAMGQSQFLSYVYGTPHMLPLLYTTLTGPMLFKCLPGILFAVGCLVIWIFAVLRKPVTGESILPAGFRTAAVALGTLFVSYALYLPKGPLFTGSLVAVDRVSGQIKWVSGNLIGLQGATHPENSDATPTPVTDGERVYGYFGAAGLLCTDTAGHVCWTCTQLPFVTRWGPATSPILCDGKVIILSESDAGNYLAALDAKTGRQVWRTARHYRIHNYTGNCRTPAVVTVQGKPVIVVWGYADLSGYDPADGHALWSYNVTDFGSFNNPVNSLVSDDTGIYLLGPAGGCKLRLDRLGKAGDPFAWKMRMPGGVQCSSPVLCHGLLFAVSDEGALFCVDPATGTLLWRRNVLRKTYASLVAAGDRVYATATDGKTVVFTADRAYHELAKNDLHELTQASIAPVDGDFFIRTVSRLYRIHP